MNKRILFFAVLLCFAISACTVQPIDDENEISMDPSQQMVDNLFSEPTEPHSETDPSSPVSEITLGSISHGPGGEKLTDETGAYRLYEGGEMRLPYDISARGFHNLGVGILLFVDGQPQPYKTSEDEAYTYMHTFYPDLKGHAAEELIFMPVAGNAGDTLELYTVNINTPGYSISDADFGFAHTSGSIASGTRLKYQETPGSYHVPDANVHASAFSKEYVELTSEDIAGWTDTELRREVEWHFFLNGAEGGNLTGIGPDEALNASFEIWGNSDVAFGVVCYLDNEPISVEGSTAIEIDIQNGKKTVVNFEIPVTQYDGQALFYAVLVPRNYRTTDAGSSCYIQTTSAFYISSQE